MRAGRLQWILALAFVATAAGCDDTPADGGPDSGDGGDADAERDGEPGACDGVTCSGHGRCLSEGVTAVCLCEVGFHVAEGGLDCVVDGADADADVDLDADADTDDVVDADADQDVDHDVESPACDGPPCAVSLHQLSSNGCGSSDDRSLDFGDVDGDGLIEALSASRRIPPDEFTMGDRMCLFANEERPAGRAFMTTTHTFAYPEGVELGEARFGNVDADPELEVISFVEVEGTGAGQLLLRDDPFSDASTQSAIDVGRPLQAGVVANLDGDIFSDVVALSWDGASSVGRIVYWIRADLGFPAEQELELGAEEPQRVLSVDVDGDGRDELVVTFPDDLSLRLYRFDGVTGTLSLADSLDLVGSPEDLTAGDFDCDGQPELALALGTAGLAVLRTTALGSFGALDLVDSTRDYIALSAGDMDGDGDDDLVAQASNNVVVHCNEWGVLSFHREDRVVSSSGRVFIGVVPIDEDEREDVALFSNSIYSLRSEP